MLPFNFPFFPHLTSTTPETNLGTFRILILHLESTGARISASPLEKLCLPPSATGLHIALQLLARISFHYMYTRTIVFHALPVPPLSTLDSTLAHVKLDVMMSSSLRWLSLEHESGW